MNIILFQEEGKGVCVMFKVLLFFLLVTITTQCLAISKIPSLIESLDQLQDADLLEVHQHWMELMIAFIKEHENSDPLYPSDNDHPIYYFDRKDAKEILKPIFKNISHFILTDQMIDHIFLEEKPLYRDNHKSSPIDFFKTEPVTSELFRVAKKTYELVKGNTLILLGQTPAYLGEMIKVISECSSRDINVINVPFSGRPNYLQKISYKNLWPTAYLDLVTSMGEKKFRDLLTERGVSPILFRKKPGKIYIVDNSSGASFACFLSLLKKWGDELQMDLPEIVFLEMCDAFDFTILNDQGKWIQAETPNLRFSESLRFDNRVIFLGMENEILNRFDKLYDNLRIVPSYNGIYWHTDCLEKFSVDYPRAEAKELIKEYQEYVTSVLGASH